MTSATISDSTRVVVCDCPRIFFPVVFLSFATYGISFASSSGDISPTQTFFLLGLMFKQNKNTCILVLFEHQTEKKVDNELCAKAFQHLITSLYALVQIDTNNLTNSFQVALLRLGLIFALLTCVLIVC